MITTKPTALNRAADLLDSGQLSSDALLNECLQYMSNDTLDKILEVLGYGDYKVKTFDDRHGGAFDRGSADSYYGRGRRPHYYVGDTGRTPEVEKDQMTPAEIEAYHAGYDYNEQYGDKKDWR